MMADVDDDFGVRVDAWTARICDALDRSPGARHIEVPAETDDDYDLFEAVAARLFDQCGVLSVHAVQRTPLVFEVGPRARDVWGPAIAEALDAAEADPAAGAVIDTHRIYEQTAKTWRNLLRLYPLSMTPYEEHLMVRLAEDMALARGLAVVPMDRHRFHVHVPGACLVDDDGMHADDVDSLADIDANGSSWWQSLLV